MDSASPSVYIIYENLHTSDRCDKAESPVPNATISLAAWEVSSIDFDGLEMGINFAGLTNFSTNPSGLASPKLNMLGIV